MQSMEKNSNTGDDIETLAALMLRAEIFCGSVEAAMKRASCTTINEVEACLKINQCRAILTRLQSLYENEQLTISNPAVLEAARYLTMALMWVAFHTRYVLEFKLFRMLVMIQSSFTFLLMKCLAASESRNS